MSARKTFLVLLLLVVFSAPVSSGEPGARRADYDGTRPLWSNSDFYFYDKDKNMVVLNLYPRTIVIRLREDIQKDKALLEKFFADAGFTEDKVAHLEKINVLLGVQEAKQAIKSQTFYVVTFRDAVPIPALLNALAEKSEVQDAFPVFSLKNDLVFPAGVWMKLKASSLEKFNSLTGKISVHNYQPSWWRPQIPVGIPPRVYYFLREGPMVTNPLLLSRVLAEDIFVEWSIPDFVSIQPLFGVTVKISRPSGTMNDRFSVSYVIKYDERKIQPDLDFLAKLGVNELRPDGVLEELFKMEEPVFKHEKGNIYFAVSFRMYQVGDFNFSLPAVPYTFVGAPQDVPPLQLNLPGVDFKVVGLVPRDKDGKPLIKDIFPWRRMPYGQPDLPPKPQLSVIYPKTDIRFWTGYLLKRVPGVNSYLERSGEILIAASLSVLAVMLGFKTFRFSLRRRKNPRRLVRRELRSLRKSLKRRYNKEEALSYGRVAKLEAMNILKLGPGLTDKEMIERAPRLARPIVSDFVGYLGKFAESGGDAGRVRAYFLRIKLAMLADKLVSIAKRPFNGEPQ